MKYLSREVIVCRKEVLKATVKEITPQYINLNNPKYNVKLIETHLELATIYDAEGDKGQAHSHFRAAENEFSNMSRVESRKPEYFVGTKEGFQRFKEQKGAVEKRLEDYKTRLVKTADKIGYDIMNLISISTGTPKKCLAEIINDHFS